jgi:regulator of replication initiation timing
VILSQFDDIDEKVESLLELCANLKAANTRLKSRIEIMEKEIRTKSEAEVRYSEKKEMVREKIVNLIEKLNHFSDAPAS